MYKYKLGLQTGGIMEDPEWHIEDIKTVHANSLKGARNEWARITGEDKKDTWDSERQTVWGWHILVLETNDNSVSDEDYWKEEE